jgi:hypothetical protein
MVSVDGIYIKRMLQLREEMSEEMENVVVRVLRNDEADKRAETDGNVHYVMHMWAVSPLILHRIPEKLLVFSFPCYAYMTNESSQVGGVLTEKLSTKCRIR